MYGAGDMQPAVTVVLINNAGGGIFSFLPIADSLQPEVFTPLWATPQNVDLAGNALCDSAINTLSCKHAGAFPCKPSDHFHTA